MIVYKTFFSAIYNITDNELFILFNISSVNKIFVGWLRLKGKLVPNVQFQQLWTVYLVLNLFN